MSWVDWLPWRRRVPWQRKGVEISNYYKHKEMDKTRAL